MCGDGSEFLSPPRLCGERYGEVREVLFGNWYSPGWEKERRRTIEQERDMQEKSQRTIPCMFQKAKGGEKIYSLELPRRQ